MYSADIVKDDIYVSSDLNGLETSETILLQKSLPPNSDLQKLTKNGEIRLVIDKKLGKPTIVAYKIETKKSEFFAYRISELKYTVLTNPKRSGNFSYPKPSKARLSSTFNPVRKNPVSGRKRPHNGVDYSMPINTPIVSVTGGVVSKAEWNSSMGNYIEIKSKNGVKTHYLHLNKILVKKGQKISDAQDIALSGNSGRSSGPHLHYELIVNNKPVDSLAFKPTLIKDNELSAHALSHIKQYEEYLD